MTTPKGGKGMEKEIVIEVIPDDGRWISAQLIIEKICEAYAYELGRLRIEVKGVVSC